MTALQHGISKKNSSPALGMGIYYARDVADILNLPYSKVRYLMKGFWHDNTFDSSGINAIHFYGLMEFHTFFKLRELGVRASEIKKAYGILKSELKSPYPFALSGIQTDGKKLWFERLGVLMQVNGRNQIAIRQFVIGFLKKIEFNDNHLAARFYPLSQTRDVVVDPNFQFGQPTISGRNLAISVIKKMYDAGESIEGIAELYDLNSHQVLSALQYFKRRA